MKIFFLFSFKSKFIFQAKEDSNEHESNLNTLERRWHALLTQINNSEQDVQQMLHSLKFEEEFQALTKAISEYQTWLETSSSSSSSIEIQV